MKINLLMKISGPLLHTKYVLEVGNISQIDIPLMEIMFNVTNQQILIVGTISIQMKNNGYYITTCIENSKLP